jgi:hypothetical protein
MLMMLVPTLLAAAAVQPASANPLAPALAGQLQCNHPNEQAKTCRSIASYKSLGGGRYSSTDTLPLSPDGRATLEVTSELTVKDSSVCGQIRREDLDKGQIKVADRALTPAEAQPIKDQVAQAMTPFFGKQACVTFVASDKGLVEKTSLDGTPRPDLDQPVKWVTPTDGYTLAP